jgi:hypothetical protein
MKFKYVGTTLTIRKNVVCVLLGNSPASELYMSTFRNTLSAPKRRHIKFRRRVITQKKAYNIQKTAKV